MANKSGATGSDLADLARRLLTEGPRKTLPTARRVRVLFRGAYIVDTTEALMVWEHDYYPQYYVPVSALQNCTWENAQEVAVSDDEKPGAAVVTISPAKGEGSTDRAVRFLDSTGPGKALAGLVRLEFASMDQWLEEDTPIYVHPKDPFKRVDTLASSRPVEVRVRGQTVARSAWAVHLYETGLRTRYYLPLAAVDPALLRPSDLVTKCPYKGEAEYYHLVVGGETLENLVWYYRSPIQESIAIAGLVCFYNEKVEILIDGKAV